MVLVVALVRLGSYASMNRQPTNSFCACVYRSLLNLLRWAMISHLIGTLLNPLLQVLRADLARSVRAATGMLKSCLRGEEVVPLSKIQQQRMAQTRQDLIAMLFFLFFAMNTFPLTPLLLPATLKVAQRNAPLALLACLPSLTRYVLELVLRSQ